MSIFEILIHLVHLTLAVWILWNSLEVVYRLFAIATTALVFILLTLWEWAWFAAKMAVLHPFERRNSNPAAPST
jgi:hypothetical protein